MVTDRKKHSAKTPIRQGPQGVTPEPNKINVPRRMTSPVRI